jgi:hypothetical protein
MASSCLQLKNAPRPRRRRPRRSPRRSLPRTCLPTPGSFDTLDRRHDLATPAAFAIVRSANSWLAAPGFVPPRFVGGPRQDHSAHRTDETLTTKSTRCHVPVGSCGAQMPTKDVQTGARRAQDRSRRPITHAMHPQVAFCNPVKTSVDPLTSSCRLAKTSVDPITGSRRVVRASFDAIASSCRAMEASVERSRASVTRRTPSKAR